MAANEEPNPEPPAPPAAHAPFVPVQLKPTPAAAPPSQARPAPVEQTATAHATQAPPAPLEHPPRPEVASPPAERNLLDAEVWRHAVELIRRASPRHGMSLAHGRVLGWADGLLTLGFGAESAFHRSTVSGNGKAVIEKNFSEWLGRPLRLAVTEAASLPGSSTSGASAPMSLAQQEAATRTSREKAAETRLRTHPAVRAALQILGGQIEHIQVLEKETLPTREFSQPTEDGA